MEEPISNGLAPFQKNGHDPAPLGHDASDGVQQTNLLYEEVLKEQQQDAPTAKMESPDAVIDQPEADAAHNADKKEQKKVKRNYASSITNTLTHCAMFIAAGKKLGAGYATPYPLYEISNLELTLETGDDLVNGVAKAESKYKYGVANRKDVFFPLEVRLTRILAELTLSGASVNTLDQVRSLIRKLRGARAVAKNPNLPAEDYHSVSQRNYDDIVANFARLVLMLADDPNYAPVIADLEVIALENTLETMRRANTEVIDTKAELDASRNARNTFFNTKVTGLVDVFLTAKKVVDANYGTTSEEYKRVKGLRFLRIRS